MTAGLLMNYLQDIVKLSKDMMQNICFTEQEILQKIKSEFCYFCEEKLGTNLACLHCLTLREIMVQKIKLF